MLGLLIIENFRRVLLQVECCLIITLLIISVLFFFSIVFDIGVYLGMQSGTGSCNHNHPTALLFVRPAFLSRIMWVDSDRLGCGSNHCWVLKEWAADSGVWLFHSVWIFAKPKILPKVLVTAPSLSESDGRGAVGLVPGTWGSMAANLENYSLKVTAKEQKHD